MSTPILRRGSGTLRFEEEGKMRCFLLRGGHIVAVKELSTDLSEEEAIEQCRSAFENSLEYSDSPFDDFEVWKRARKVYQHSLDEGLLASSWKRACWP